MFFHLERGRATSDLNKKHGVGKWTLSVDEGWKQQGNVFYKGYVLHGDMDYKIQCKNFREQAGNYTIIVLDDDKPKIYHSESRAYPLWYTEDQVTNTAAIGEPVWFSEFLSYDNGFKKQHVPWHIPPMNEPHDFNSIVATVCHHVIRYLEGIPRNLPWYAGDSNGVDTALVCAAADYLGFKYKLAPENTKNRLADLPWGYRQLYYSHEPHFQLTGFCGDEVMARNPMYMNWLALPYEIDLDHEYDQVGKTYMSGFYQKRYREKIIKDNTVKWGSDVMDARSVVANHVMNDFQMWHIDNVLTVTPFRSAELLYNILNTDIDVLVQQCTSASISLEAIRRLNPKWLDKIATYKNGYEPA